MNVDLVVLDIDGVLVDTDGSYDRAIIDTLAHVVGETIDREDIQLFKDAGGFNNDWDVTDAAALALLARKHGVELDLESVTDDIDVAGGGLEAAEEVISGSVPDPTWTRIRSEWGRNELRRTFQWLYLGPDRYEQFENEPHPTDPPATGGYIEDEPQLVSAHTIEILQDGYELGILTGRPAAEAEIALSRLDLDIPPERRMTMDDWEGGKPAPDGLIELAKTVDAETTLFAGDELDDVRTAVNAATADSSRSYCGVGVETGGVRGEDGRQRFREVGACETLASINELPDLLKEKA